MMKTLLSLIALVSGLLWAAVAHSEINLVRQEADGFRLLIVEGESEANYDVDEFTRTVRSIQPSSALNL